MKSRRHSRMSKTRAKSQRKRSRSCPNVKFTNKHYCSWCKSASDAFYFTLLSRGPDIKRGKVFTSTVLGGPKVKYYKHGTTCRNVPTFAFKCFNLARYNRPGAPNRPTCYPMGYVECAHDRPSSGHLYRCRSQKSPRRNRKRL